MAKKKIKLYETTVELQADVVDDLMDDSDDGASDSSESRGMDFEITTDIRAAAGPSGAPLGAGHHGHLQGGMNMYDATDEYDST